MNIKNKVVVVTGGASGLGLAACRYLAKLQAKLVIFDIDDTAGQALLDELHALKVEAIFVNADVTDAACVKLGVAQALSAFGAIHVCINCAGVVSAGKTLGRNGPLSLDKFSQVININLIGTFNVLRLVAEQMANNEEGEKGECGVIINTASVAAFDGQVGQVAYSASKAGIVGMTLPLARDLARQGIRVMAIAPGVFDTPMMQGMSDEVRDPLIAMVQSPKRFGQPLEYAQLCLHIVENSYLNGEVIRLDGGMRMEPR